MLNKHLPEPDKPEAAEINWFSRHKEQQPTKR